ELEDVLLADPVDARVADVDRERQVGTYEHRREGGRHPLLLGVELGHAEHHVTGVLHTALQEAADLPHALRITCLDALDQAIEITAGPVDPHGELLDGLPARDLALVMPAYTVGDDIEAALIIAEEGVLVDLALSPDVSAR